jgi:adenine deaminase
MDNNTLRPDAFANVDPEAVQAAVTNLQQVFGWEQQDGVLRPGFMASLLIGSPQVVSPKVATAIRNIEMEL